MLKCSAHASTSRAVTSRADRDAAEVTECVTLEVTGASEVGRFRLRTLDLGARLSLTHGSAGDFPTRAERTEGHYFSL